MILDASAFVELILRTPRGSEVQDRLEGIAGLAAPDSFDVEVISVLRRLERSEVMSLERAHEAVVDLGRASIRRYPVRPLIARAWQLRLSISPDDAVYVALAERLEVPLLTADQRLARSHGHRATILSV